MMGCPPKLFTYYGNSAIYIFHTHLSLKFKLSWSHITLHKRLTFDRSFILAWKNWKTKRRGIASFISSLFCNPLWVQQNCRYHHTIAMYVKSWLVWPLARPCNMQYCLYNVLMYIFNLGIIIGGNWIGWMSEQLKSVHYWKWLRIFQPKVLKILLKRLCPDLVNSKSNIDLNLDKASN